MTRLTPQQAEARARSIPGRFTVALRRELPAIRRRIASVAIGRYMRDAKGEGRRRAEDRGPLRIVSGDYAKAIRGGEEGSIDRVTETGNLRLKYEMGVSLREVPQGVNERGTDNGFGRGITIPARPTFLRALPGEIPYIKKRAEAVFRKAVLGAFS